MWHHRDPSLLDAKSKAPSKVLQRTTNGKIGPVNWSKNKYAEFLPADKTSFSNWYMN